MFFRKAMGGFSYRWTWFSIFRVSEAKLQKLIDSHDVIWSSVIQCPLYWGKQVGSNRFHFVWAKKHGWLSMQFWKSLYSTEVCSQTPESRDGFHLYWSLPRRRLGVFMGWIFFCFWLKLFRFCVGAPLLTGQRESTLGPHSSLGLWLFLGFQAFLAHGMAAWISDFRCVTTLFDPKCRQSYRNSPAACYFCNDVTAPSDLWQPINQIPYLCCVNGTQICR